MRLKDRVAFVTGGSGGLGQAIAERFLEEGAFVVVADIDAARLEAMVASSTAEAGRLTSVILDVSDYDKVKAAIDKVVDDFGRLDILVNNAGFSPKKNWLDYSIAEWKQVIDVNLSGEYYGARAVAEHMMERQQGRIINLSSSAWRHGGVSGGGGVPYTSSKAGIIGLTRSLAKALGAYNVTVNAIAPGYTDTDMVSAVPANVLEKIVAKIPVGRLGKAEEIGRGVMFLIADDAGFITGSTLSINGGQHMY